MVKDSKTGKDDAFVGPSGLGAGGGQAWLPDADADDAAVPAPSGREKLGTSGRDDVERGDTVSGLGTADVRRSSKRRRRAVPPGPQSGAPTPGNRFPASE